MHAAARGCCGRARLAGAAAGPGHAAAAPPGGDDAPTLWRQVTARYATFELRNRSTRRGRSSGTADTSEDGEPKRGTSSFFRASRRASSSGAKCFRAKARDPAPERGALLTQEKVAAEESVEARSRRSRVRAGRRAAREGNAPIIQIEAEAVGVWWKSKLRHPTPSTRCCLRKCVSSMAGSSTSSV